MNSFIAKKKSVRRQEEKKQRDQRNAENVNLNIAIAVYGFKAEALSAYPVVVESAEKNGDQWLIDVTSDTLEVGHMIRFSNNVVGTISSQPENMYAVQISEGTPIPGEATWLNL